MLAAPVPAAPAPHGLQGPRVLCSEPRVRQFCGRCWRCCRGRRPRVRPVFLSARGRDKAPRRKHVSGKLCRPRAAGPAAARSGPTAGQRTFLSLHRKDRLRLGRLTRTRRPEAPADLARSVPSGDCSATLAHCPGNDRTDCGRQAATAPPGASDTNSLSPAPPPPGGLVAASAKVPQAATATPPHSSRGATWASPGVSWQTRAHGTPKPRRGRLPRICPGETAGASAPSRLARGHPEPCSSLLSRWPGKATRHLCKVGAWTGRPREAPVTCRSSSGPGPRMPPPCNHISGFS